MLMGCIADDFTGATDLGVNLVREGLTVVQVNGVPTLDFSAPEVDVIVVALKTRTVSVTDAVKQSVAALRWLQSAGAERIYFKYCSTFDSTDRGNIGPVCDALLDALGASFTVVTPAYPRQRRTVYKGHLFVGDMLLSDSSMRDHPLTPMTDANLVRVLSRQTPYKVSLVDYEIVEQGAVATRARLDELQGEGCRYAVLDLISEAHLITAGIACAQMPFSTGSAGLATGIAKALLGHGKKRGLSREPAAVVDASASVAILSGSCSSATLDQVARARAFYPSRALDPVSLANGEDSTAAVVDWALKQVKRQAKETPFMLYASAPREQVDEAQNKLGAHYAADLIENVFRELVVKLADAGVRRFVVAGGETSGAIVEALGIRALTIGNEIVPGVPWTFEVGGRGCRLALKSGNFGSPDFFCKATESAP